MKVIFPPVTSEEQAIRMVLFRFILSGYVIFGLLFALTGPFVPNVELRYGLLGVGLAVTGLITMGVNRLRHPFAARLTLVILSFLVITIFAMTGGGIRSLAFLDYIGLALMTGLIFGEVASLSVVVLTLLIGLGFILADEQTLLAPFVHHSPLSIWFSYLFILPMVFALQSLHTFGLRRALQNAALELTQRKLAEEQFRKLVDATPNALILVNAQGIIQISNHPAEKLFGYSMAELQGCAIEKLIPNELRAEHVLHEAAFFTHPTPRQMGMGKDLKGVHKDGHRIPVEVGLSPLEMAEGMHMLVSIMDITERKQAEDTHQRLLELSQAALSAATPAEIIERTMNILRESLPFDYLGLRLLDEARGILRGVSSIGSMELKDLCTQWDLPLDQGIAGQVAQTGIPECVNNAHLDPRTVYPPGFSVACEHAICLPMWAEDKIFGVLFIARYVDQPFTPDEYEISKMYLSHVTLAIYNAHLREVANHRLHALETTYQQIQVQNELLEERVDARTQELHKEIAERKQTEDILRRRNEYLTALHTISLDMFNRRDVEEVLNNILYNAVHLLNAPYGYVGVMEENQLVDWATYPPNTPYQKNCRRVSSTENPIFEAFRRGRPYLIENYSTHPGLRAETAQLGLQTGILAPILAGTNPLGLLGVFHIQPDQTFSPEDVRTLELFAQLAALALDNAQLLAQEKHEAAERNRTEERLRRYVGHLSLLHQITLDLLQQRNVDDLLQMIVDQISHLVDVDWGCLTLKEEESLVDRAQLKNPDVPYQMVASHRGDDPTSPIWQVVDTMQPFIATDYSELMNIRPETAALGLKAVIILPVFLNNTCQGTLGIGRTRSDHPFGEEELRLAYLLARIAGIILENAQLHETLRQEAIRDPLTTLFNRRFMEESLTRELQRAERDRHPLTVAMLDLDRFKIFNDTYGHPAGDEVLRALGELLKDKFRGSDIACRYGGEEFTLILPETNINTVSPRIEQLRSEIADITVEYQGHPLPQITISIGLAEYPQHASTTRLLLTRADEALYKAKNAGRNRVEVFSVP